MITTRRRKRLRRRYAASSIAAKRRESATFYLDESIYCRRLAEGLRSAGVKLVTLFEAELTGASDESWLSAIGAKRWLALMRDQNIRRRTLERRALLAARVGAFVCTAGQATSEEITTAVLRLIGKMTRIAASESRPFIFTFGLTGRLRPVPGRELT